MTLKPKDIQSLFESVSRRLWWYTASLGITGVLGVSLILVRSTHKALCTAVLAKLESVERPLARELALENTHTAKAILTEVIQELEGPNLKTRLEFIPAQNPTIESKTNLTPECHIDSVGATVSYPVTFAGSLEGYIKGRLSGLRVAPILLVIAFFLLLLVVVTRWWLRLCLRSLKKKVLQPLILLSQGHTLSPEQSQLSEVVLLKTHLEETKKHLLERERLLATLHKMRSLAALAAQVGHDIRSPALTLSYLAEHPGEISDIKKQKLVSGTAKRIHAIANDLLRKQKAWEQEAPDMPLPNPAYHEAQTMLEELILEKKLEWSTHPNLQFHYECSEAFKASRVWVDPLGLQRLFSNLLNNAIEAQAHSIDVMAYLDEKTARIHIRDNGSGFPQKRSGAWCPGEMSTLAPRGFGLGLSYAYHCLQHWGGSLEVDSAPEQGTTVLLNLVASQ